jgi:hypothetical protein
VEVGVNIYPTRATPAADGNDLGHTVLVETRAPNHNNTTHNPTLDGLVCNDPCDDHAIQCLGVSPGAGASQMQRPSDQTCPSKPSTPRPSRAARTQWFTWVVGRRSRLLCDVQASGGAQHFVMCDPKTEGRIYTVGRGGGGEWSRGGRRLCGRGARAVGQVSK